MHFFLLIHNNTFMIIIASDRQSEVTSCHVKSIASDPVSPHAVKQHGRPAATRLRSIRAEVPQMANRHTSMPALTLPMTTVLNAVCPTPSVKSRKQLMNCIDAFIDTWCYFLSLTDGK